nr:substrate-binding domain-containing protein [Ruminococcus sp.]
IIAPSADDDELADALHLAQSNGVKVLTIDSDVREEARSCCISTNNTYAGAIAARQAADLLGGQGSIGIVIHLPTASNSIERKSGFTSQIDSYNADAGENVINIAATENGNGNILESKEAALKLMNDNPDIGLIFATSQSSTIGTCMAVDELGKADSVDVIGFDSFYSKEGSKSSDEYMDNGVLDGFILQNPYNAGYISVRYANDLINGQNIAGSVDTGATFVTKDNINNSDIQLIMNPTKFMEEFNNG